MSDALQKNFVVALRATGGVRQTLCPLYGMTGAPYRISHLRHLEITPRPTFTTSTSCWGTCEPRQ